MNKENEDVKISDNNGDKAEIIKLLEEMKEERKLEAKNRWKRFWIMFSLVAGLLFICAWFFSDYIEKVYVL